MRKMKPIMKGGKKKMYSLIEIGAIAAILELGFWLAVLYFIYKHNRGEQNVQ